MQVLLCKGLGRFTPNQVLSTKHGGTVAMTAHKLRFLRAFVKDFLIDVALGCTS
jgi:hypothetical protein